MSAVSVSTACFSLVLQISESGFGTPFNISPYQLITISAKPLQGIFPR